MLQNKLKEQLLSHISKVIVLFALGSIILFYNDFLMLMKAHVDKIISTKDMSELLVQLTLVSLLLILLAYIFHQKNKKSLTLKYGIYWDYNKNPHCPSCEKPVSKYDSFGMNSEKGYWCDSCRIQSNLADYTGKSVTPKEAVRSLSWWIF